MNKYLPITHLLHFIPSRAQKSKQEKKEILTIETKEHLTFPETRAKARLTFNASSRSYTTVAGNTHRRSADASASLPYSSRPGTSFAAIAPIPIVDGRAGLLL